MKKVDKATLKTIIKEILIENKVIVSNEQENRRKRLEALIDKDFDNYDDVFNALG